MVYRGKSLVLAIIPIVLSLPFLAMAPFKVWIGLLAYCLFMWDSILGLRPKGIEKHIDLQNMYMMHGMIAIAAVGFGLLHKEISHLHGLAGDIGDIAMTIAIVGTGLALVLLTSQVGRVIPILKAPLCWIQRLCQRFFITREVNVWLHMLAPVIVVLLVLHVLFIPEYSQNSSFMMLFLGYFIVFVACYLYLGVYKKLATTTYQVKEVIQQGNGAYELVMTYEKGKKLCHLQGGQFIFIHTKESQFAEYHPFSVLAIDGNKAEEIHLGIRESGDYTKKLAHIKPEEKVKVRGVYGHFTKKHIKQEYVVAIGGGIGITPCMSLMQSVNEIQKGVLIWSVHDQNDVMFKEELQKLKATHPNIKVVIHSSREQGHLNKASLIEYIGKDRLLNSSIFICGPDAMTDAILKNLHDLHVNNKNIISEGFIF